MKAANVMGGAWAALWLAAPAAEAVTVVNIDFGLVGDHPGGIVSAGYTGTAAAPDAGTVWNDVRVTDNNAFQGPPGEFGFWTSTVSVGSLVDSLGNPTGIGVNAIASGDTGAFGILQGTTNLDCVATDAIDLMRDYLIGFNGAQTVELTGFATGVLVDLYLYGAGDTSNRDTVFSVTDINGLHTATTTGTLSSNGGSPVAHTLTLGGDYVVLSGLVPDINGKITIFYDNGAGSGEAPFNGLQAVIVPEPAGAMMLAAALPLAFRRRRRAG